MNNISNYRAYIHGLRPKIDKYITKTYGKDLPVPIEEIMPEGEYIL